jgi:hypothetical protein
VQALRSRAVAANDIQRMGQDRAAMPSTTTIRIRPQAPDKPALGQACNGCGVCCMAEPCPLGALISLRRRGACKALRWDEGRYRCGAARWPGLLGALARRWIAAGRGCDSDAVVS